MRALILAMWAILAPGSERFESAIPIADAIATACGGDEGLASHLATYAWLESSLRPAVTGDGGRSCGPWQMRCSDVRGLSLEAQARLWLQWVQASSLGAVDSSPSRARRRAKLAASLLDRVHGG